MSGRTMIAGVIGEAKDPDILITQDGTQYAKLPEGWPAAEAKELEEAHAEAVMADEPDDGLTDLEREIYRLSPEEVKELLVEYVEMAEELTALRKGMKTMQRKSRKQAQVKRRLERRLAQARAARDRAQENVSFYTKASLRRALAEAGLQVNAPEVK